MSKSKSNIVELIVSVRWLKRAPGTYRRLAVEINGEEIASRYGPEESEPAQHIAWMGEWDIENDVAEIKAYQDSRPIREGENDEE